MLSFAAAALALAALMVATLASSARTAQAGPTHMDVRCDAADLRDRLPAFVRAYNRGDLRQLNRLFSHERFKWYSWGGTARSNRDALLRNFDRRYKHGDRLRSVAFRFTGSDQNRGFGHFQLRAQRRADDILDGAWFSMTGKGALDCSRLPVTFALMFLGMPR